MSDWEEDFQELIVQLGEMSKGYSFRPVELNQAVWELNRASMFLSRFMQHNLCGHAMDLNDGSYLIIQRLSELAKIVASGLEHIEKTLPDSVCLECLEDDTLGE